MKQESLKWIFGVVLAFGAPAAAGAASQDWPAPPVSARPAHAARARAVEADPQWTRYNPASPTASSADRQSSWETLRVRSVDPGGRVDVGGKLLNLKQERDYYWDARMEEPLKLFKQSEAKRSQGKHWMVAAPITGFAIGFVAADIAEASAAPNNGQITGQDIATILGSLVGGTLLGAGIGWTVHHSRDKEAQDLRRQAADSFNQGLLRDLRLDAAPVPGGAAMGVSGHF